MKRLILFGLVLISLLFIVGCTQPAPTQKEYVCSNNQIVLNPENCPKESIETEPSCGDGTCQSSESCSSCSSDCGACSKKIGETCVTNWECESNFCIHQSGAEYGLCKDNCDYTLVTCSQTPCTLCSGKDGYCYDGTCYPTKRPIDQSCKQNSDCQSNFCQSYVYSGGTVGICKISP